MYYLYNNLMGSFLWLGQGIGMSTVVGHTLGPKANVAIHVLKSI